MIRLEFGLSLCGPLIKCLAEIGAETLSAATSFVDAEALEELAKTAEAVRVVVGDYAVPREVYERWRDAVRIYPGHAGNLYIGARGLAAGGAPLTAAGLRSPAAANFAALVPPAVLREAEGYFSGLWRRAQPLAEDAAVDASAEDLLRAPHAGEARRANERLAEALGPGAARCLAEFRPGDCARPVAEALRERYRGCGRVEEACAAADVHREVSPRRLLAAPDSAHLAGHPACWLRAFAVRLVEERRGFRSGIEAYEAMLKAAAEDCPRRLRAPAEEELARLQDGAYRNEAMWTIPYRLLPLALTLPAIGCRIEGSTRRDGRSIRQIIC
ncbi:MAG: hypothetical protein RXR06_12175 [Thermoproteus sp.]|jgi:hypothetical protein